MTTVANDAANIGTCSWTLKTNDMHRKKKKKKINTPLFETVI
jgi:hypothetical protein